MGILAWTRLGGEVDLTRNWRHRVWQGTPERTPAAARGSGARRPPKRGCAPYGARPRDLRSSYVTVQVYAGTPLTTIAKQSGTSVAMLERHYAGVIANWNGRQIPAAAQIYAARRERERRKSDAPPIRRADHHHDQPGFLAL